MFLMLVLMRYHLVSRKSVRFSAMKLVRGSFFFGCVNLSRWKCNISSDRKTLLRRMRAGNKNALSIIQRLALKKKSCVLNSMTIWYFMLRMHGIFSTNFLSGGMNLKDSITEAIMTFLNIRNFLAQMPVYMTKKQKSEIGRAHV